MGDPIAELFTDWPEDRGSERLVEPKRLALAVHKALVYLVDLLPDLVVHPGM